MQVLRVAGRAVDSIAPRTGRHGDGCQETSPYFGQDRALLTGTYAAIVVEWYGASMETARNMNPPSTSRMSRISRPSGDQPPIA